MKVKVHPSAEQDVESPPHEVTSSIESLVPVTLTWENINVKLKPQNVKPCPCFGMTEEKHILHGVSGYVKPGTMLAVIGASGSGKTTLLNTLTGRSSKKTLSTTGSIRANGQEIDVRDISAFVPQDDLFLPTLTVREHLTFRAMVHMEKSMSREDRLARVDGVMKELGLTKCADSKIGDPATEKGISGGQMRRLSFASEMLTNPPLLFCDEPTSGLDSFMAGALVQTLKNEANMGRTVLCTIHQPSSEVFAMFDRLLIMAEGKVTFMGTTAEALAFYANSGFRCPPTYNPSDFFVHENAIRPGREEECRAKVKTLYEKFESSDHAKDIQKVIEDTNAQVGQSTNLQGHTKSHKFGSSWPVQFSNLVVRSWRTTYRNKIVVAITGVQTLALALLCGLVFLRMDLDQTSVMDINGALFLVTLTFSVTAIYPALNVFPAEVPIFLRDYITDLYRVDAYYLSKVVVEFPVHMTMPVIFCAITYWMIGFYESGPAFGVFIGALLLVDNVSVAVGYIISALAPSSGIAVAIAAPVFIVLMLFGGFFLNNVSVPAYLIWLEYLSWFKYANEIVTVNQWKNVDSIECPVVNGVRTSACLFGSGDEVLNYLHYEESNLVGDWIALGVMLVGFRIIAFVVLLARAKLSVR